MPVVTAVTDAYGISEVHVRAPGRDTIRKRFPRTQDAPGQVDTQHLAQIPYNIRNKLISVDDVFAIFARVGMKVTVQNLALYQQAFVHKSYIQAALQWEGDESAVGRYGCTDHDFERCVPALQREGYLPPEYDLGSMVPLQDSCGETLEFVGDAVCGLSVGTYLKTRYPEENEGFLTRLRTRLVCGSKLGEFAERIGLAEHVVMSRYVEIVNCGRKNHKVLEDFFENFVGALFEDSGMNFTVCHEFIIRVVERYADLVDMIAHENNHKDTLLRFFQKHFNGAFPVYKEIAVDVDQNGIKTYTCGVISADNPDHVIATGTDRKKRTAEQECSRKALEYFGVGPEDMNRSSAA